jgi:DNA-binding XRE family transcriptional regulator
LLTLVGCRYLILSLVLHTEISNMRKKSNISIRFGEKVREIRISKGLSQEQLAHIADVHRTYIGMIERAEKNITLVNVEKIANALEVSIIDLLK